MPFLLWRTVPASRSSRSAGTLCPPAGGSGTGGYGFEPVGTSVPVDAPGGPASRDLCFQRRGWSTGNNREAEGLLPFMSPEVDDGCIGLHQRVGLHSRPEVGGDQEVSSARAGSIPQPTSQAKVSKVEGRRRSSRFFESRRSMRKERRGSLPHDGIGSDPEEDAVMYEEFGMGVTMKPMSLHAWSCSITRCLLRGRTPFSRFLRRSLDGCNGGHLDATATALFPIPLPPHGQWLFGPQRLGKARRFRAAVHRVVHFVVLALNYLHCGDGFDLELLRRSPSQAHLEVYQRMEALIRAGGPPDAISIVGCGRKSFQLGARLKELVGCLQSLGLNEKSAYHQGGGTVPVPQCNDLEELVPYRPLNAARPKLSGQGHWECSHFIDPLFYMPFVEPRVNQYDLVPDFDDLPNFKQIDKEEVLKVCKVWDVQGLLRIYPVENGPKKPFAYTKIFNNYKSVEKDRQIGDRIIRILPAYTDGAVQIYFVISLSFICHLGLSFFCHSNLALSFLCHLFVIWVCHFFVILIWPCHFFVIYLYFVIKNDRKMTKK